MKKISNINSISNNKKFWSIHNITFIGVYIAIIAIFNFTPQFGNINIAIAPVITIFVPLIFMGLHLGWKASLIGWFAYGVMYFLTVLTQFVGVLPFIHWGGAFVVYGLGKMLVGLLVTGTLVLMNVLENKFKINKNIWHISKITAMAVVASGSNAIIFSTLWYLLDDSGFAKTFFFVFIGKSAIAFPIELAITIPLCIAAWPLLKYLQKVEQRYIANKY